MAIEYTVHVEVTNHRTGRVEHVTVKVDSPRRLRESTVVARAAHVAPNIAGGSPKVRELLGAGDLEVTDAEIVDEDEY
jgi:redox-regulated HSP33 family molecular chaperone